jgi:P pilus assembly chaperone PapD
VSVTNLGQTPAQIRVEGAPRWLLVKPEGFRLAAGARQTVKLVVRIDKLRGSREEARLKFAVDGGEDREIEVRVKVRRRGLFG